MLVTKPAVVQRPKILAVDDNPANLLVIRRVLAKLDVEVVEAASGNDALKATLDDEFALVLLDVYMPDINGFEVAEILSQEESTRQTPIIFVTATYADDVHRLKGYGFGAVDYMAKPLEATMLLSKVQVFLELYRHRVALRDALSELSERNRQLEIEVEQRKQMEQEMRHLAMHDMLTGLPNRALFMDRLESAHHRAQRHGGMFALVYVDVDRFKAVNDTWGHGAGDAVLIELATRLRGALRENDTVARLGGDEFALVLEELDDINDAHRLMERVSESLLAPMHYQRDGEQLTLSIGASIGLAAYPADGAEVDALLHAADQAMYLTKRSRETV
ncbi:diguanylate cyclase domain-containing protein [Stenotrophomonas pigmentata]|uniref:diguanylate cyclase domain-containing protein n=1 Tax=Stenotrophomonas pigmentata TaxID=3055080 RepID=UPI0026EE6602|nr:diguanylate cyclase [Stenotrophomonas sp. 610A2]